MASDADEPDVPILCSECGTETRVSLSEVADMLEKHNRTQHGGEECAQVDPALADQLADIVADDMGLLE